MNKTLNNITDALRELTVGHQMINDFGLGHTANIGTDRLDEGRQLAYPYLWVDYSGTRYAFGGANNLAYKLYTMTVIVVDKYTPNLQNSSEVMSDTEGILSDVIAYISSHPDLAEFRLNLSEVSAEPVRDDEKDGVEGWMARLTFKIPYTLCYTGLPVQ